MTTPCDKGPLLQEILHSIHGQGDTLNAINKTLENVAIQGERVTTLEKKSEDIEARLRKLEPLRFLFPILKWVSVVGGGVAIAWTTYLLGFGG